MSDLGIGKECGGGRLGDVKVQVEPSLKILCPFWWHENDNEMAVL